MIDQIQQAQFPALHQGGSETGSLDNLHRLFIQNVSHEMRTPLGIIQGYAELLHAGDLGALAPEQQKAMHIIVDRTHELRTMAERIGVLLAVRAHVTTSMPLALDEVVTEVVEGRQAAAAQAGVTIETHLESGLPLVPGDQYNLQQAIDCLVENALKFTPAGGRVEVRTYTLPATHNEKEKEKKWVCLDVTDTGIGIEEPERIFSGFYQVDGSTTRRYGGIGLGLTVAMAVIQEHAGQLEVESQPGQGSRFTVKLPALLPMTQVEAAIEQPVESSTPLQRILIVDDEAIVTLVLQEGLENIPNCEIATAASGEQALQLFAEQPFDLLLTDYKMPGTDGMTLATRVRQLYPQTIIIMLTAYSDDALREQAARASIRRVLDKPVKLAEINRIVLESLGQPER